MTTARYFQCSLSLPIIGGAAALGILSAIPHLGGKPVVGPALNLLGASLLPGVVLYLPFAFAVLYWLRGEPESTYRRAALLAPLAFASMLSLVPLFVHLVGLLVSPADASGQEFAMSVGGVFVVVLAVSYLWVGVAFAGLRVLTHAGLVEAQREGPAA